MLHWIIFPKYDVHQLNVLLQDTRVKNQGTMILGQADLYLLCGQRSCHTDLFILKYDIHPSNSLKDIRQYGQYHWTMNLASSWDYGTYHIGD